MNTPSHNSKNIKVTTLNVLHTDWSIAERAESIASELVYRDPDFVLLQEVPQENGGKSTFLETLVNLTGLSVDAVSLYGDNPYNDCLVTLSKGYSVIEKGNLCQTEVSSGNFRSTYVVYQKDENKFVAVFNVHGFWGGEHQHVRERDIVRLNEKAKHLERKYAGVLIILGGDMNSEPDSSVARYLTGKQSLHGEGTYWVDAWEVAGDTKINGHTVSPNNLWGRQLAKTIGIKNPEQNPSRRIDYIYTKGWVYGRDGYPLNAELSFTTPNPQGYTPSDHYGVSATLQMLDD